MAEITPIPVGVRSRCEPATEARDARRLIGLERHYRCRPCGREHRSWARLYACPDCGAAFVSAVIRRAAFAA
jgi:rubrerythrin